MQEKVREYIKEYYKVKVIDTKELRKLKFTILTIKEKTVNLADLLKFCTPYLPEDAKYSERLYNIINNIYSRPICPTCNNNTCKFKDYNKGYSNTCSVKCSNNNDDKKEKIKQLLLEKYGVENASQIPEGKKKYKQTCLKKYGVEHHLQNNNVIEKRKQTNLEKYGYEWGLQNNNIIDKREKTNLIKYGYKNVFQNKEVQDKSKQTFLEKYGDNNYKKTFKYKIIQFNQLLNNKERLNNCTPLFDLKEFKNNNVNTNYKFKWQCNICKTIFFDDISNGRSPICPGCYKIYGSSLQKEIYDFIYNYTTNIYLNDKRFKFEIDILLVDYNLGIEVNGNYWHSDLHGKDKYYHLNKTLECAKNNISLIHIFEDDWLYKKDIVKNLILDKLNLITNTVDNLSIYKITDDMSAEFLNNNCINGNITNQDNILQNNVKHYGLCTHDDIYYLISVDITNSKIIRYCSKLNYKVSNDNISKLISHICKENNLENLTVYCDLRYDSGELFKALGFNYLKFKHPTYELVHIKNYSIKINKDDLIFENYNNKLSIWYNAMNNNYDRIWNCGYLIYFYN